MKPASSKIYLEYFSCGKGCNPEQSSGFHQIHFVWTVVFLTKELFDRQVKLWGLFQIFRVCCHLFLSNSPQRSSGKSYVFIQSIIFWGLGYGCTGRQEDASWHLSTSSKDGAKREHPGGKHCRAQSGHSGFQHMLLPAYLYHCCYCYFCCVDYAVTTSLFATYLLC